MTNHAPSPHLTLMAESVVALVDMWLNLILWRMRHAHFCMCGLPCGIDICSHFVQWTTTMVNTRGHSEEPALVQWCDCLPLCMVFGSQHA